MIIRYISSICSKLLRNHNMVKKKKKNVKSREENINDYPEIISTNILAYFLLVHECYYRHTFTKLMSWFKYWQSKCRHAHKQFKKKKFLQVLVARVTLTRNWVAKHPRNQFSHNSGSLNSKIKVQTELVSSEVSLLGLYTAFSSMCPHMVFHLHMCISKFVHVIKTSVILD